MEPATSFAWLFRILCLFTSKSLLIGSSIDTSYYSFSINMPDVSPSLPDSYLCTAKKLGSLESYIVQYEPDANDRNMHHLLLFGCRSLHSQTHLYPGYWSCGGNLCNQMTNMYGWAKNAPAVKFPPNVGFLVGGNSSIQYLILQIHYSGIFPEGVTDNSGLRLQMTTQRQPYITGIHLLLAETAEIPPHRPKYHVDVNCKFSGSVPIHVFAYRVHTHSLGTVVCGYTFSHHNSTWRFLSRGYPQQPQAFYPTEQIQTVTDGDVLAARCTYNSTKSTHPVRIGSSATDEMCNLYLMYYTEYSSKMTDHLSPCVDAEFPKLTHSLPDENSEVLSFASRSHLESTTYDARDRAYSKDTVYGAQDSSSNHSFFSEALKHLDQSAIKYKVFPQWPSAGFSFGQISAVIIDSEGNPVIFHRGDHVWNEYTFDLYHNYLLSSKGAIKVPTVVTIDSVSGLVLDHWGSNMFYMPHGLHVDQQQNYWLTDVALHQVFCFRKTDLETPVLVLGERFVPGNDHKHFCKPASVAVSKDNDVFVADGYCNSRIMHFSYDGKFLMQWGKESNYFDSHPPVGTFRIPHKVILVEDKQLVCVADRENGRIQCFLQNGSFRFQISEDEFGGTVYSIAYSEKNGLLFAVSGESVYRNSLVKAFVFNITDQTLLSTITPSSGTFSRPHDIAVSTDSEEVYVCEIGPNVVWKFLKDYHKSSKKVLDEASLATSLPLPSVSHNIDGVFKVYDAKNIEMKPKVFGKEPEGDNFQTSIVVLSLLGIPILLLILVMSIIRLRKRGKFQNISLSHIKGWLGGYRTPQTEEKFNIGNFLNPYKGFDKVAVEDSDNSESDNEEFDTATTKKA